MRIAMRNGYSWAAALAAMVIAVFVMTATAPADAKAATASSGAQYAVGTRSYTFVDSRRRTAANGSYPGAATRTLRTQLLYPAKGDRQGAAVKGAKPIQTREGFPLIVFSHGFGASGPAYQFLLERYVRQGYVVAAPTFPSSSGSAPGGPKGGDYVNQPADVSFVLSRVLALKRYRGSSRRTIDRGHIGVAGHSLGAITTLGLASNSCCRDRRIDAAVAFSGIQLPFSGGSFSSKRTTPLMLVHGSQDRTVPYAGSLNAYEQAGSPRVLMRLKGGPHVPFTAPWLDPTIRSTTDFLDGFLKRDRKALRRLSRDGTVRGVSSVRIDLR